MYENEINISESVLMGPGPTNVHPRILKAMSQQIIGHLDEQYVQMSHEISDMLRHIFQTRNEMTIAISGPGSAGMETCLINLLEPGDEALICINGVFGKRMADMANRCGAKVIKVVAEYGEIISVEQIHNALKTCRPKLIAAVHAETSSGVLQPLEEIGKIANEVNALFVVDAVVSFTGVEIKMDEWHIDAIYASTQKCLGAPPGMALLSLSQKAMDVITYRKTTVQSWILDISLIKDCINSRKRIHPYTSPISNTYALYEALLMVMEEGLENRYRRHVKIHSTLLEGLKTLGLELVVRPEYRIPFVNVVKIPDGIDDTAFRNQLKQSYNIEIAGGLGTYTGKVWRIGLMGEACREDKVTLLVTALQELLLESKIIT